MTQTVLLVEDDDVDAMAITRSFKRCGQETKLIRVTNGKEAIDHLRAENDLPDLVIMDIKMPVMNGLEALDVIKKDQDLCHIPIVITSTSSDPHDIQACYKSRGNSYIVKPSGTEASDLMIKTLTDYWFKLATLPSKFG